MMILGIVAVMMVIMVMVVMMAMMIVSMRLLLFFTFRICAMTVYYRKSKD